MTVTARACDDGRVRCGDQELIIRSDKLALPGQSR